VPTRNAGSPAQRGRRLHIGYSAASFSLFREQASTQDQAKRLARAFGVLVQPLAHVLGIGGFEDKVALKPKG
jgi:hypothetical protein